MRRNKHNQGCALDDMKAINRALAILKDPERLSVVMELLEAGAQNQTVINIRNLNGDLNLNTQRGECHYE